MPDQKQLLQEVKQAIKDHDKKRARALLGQILPAGDGLDKAWAYYACVAKSRQQAVACLKKAVDINPANDEAWALLKKYESEMSGDGEAGVPAQKRSAASEPEKTLWQDGPTHIPYVTAYVLGAVTAIFGVGLIILIVAVLDKKYRNYTITCQRVIAKSGIISKKIIEVRLKDIRSIDVRQGILERCFDVGTILITTAGTGGVEITIWGVVLPERVRPLLEYKD